MKKKNSYTIVRGTFPHVWGTPEGYMVNARSKRWGINIRKTFPTEKEALDFRNQISQSMDENGKQPDLGKEVKSKALLYSKLEERLVTFGKTVDEAINHYTKFLSDEIIHKAKPPIRELADKWREFKYEDKTLSHRTNVEIRSYARFIKNKWGDLKPDDLKRNEIDILMKRLRITNNTRRKYLRYIRMFFSWVKDEGYIIQNPTDGIFYKPDDFNGGFYSPEVTKKLLRYVVENEKDLIGYYVLLTFAGLRPSEGARVEWQDYNSKTSELYVRKGKTNARHIILEPVAVEWMKWHRDNTPQGKPFIDLCSLGNREKRIRKAVLNGEWIQDALRHGFGTYYKSKIKDVGRVADYMGNSADIVKRHYARTIPADECSEFWGLNPSVVLGGASTVK